MEHDLQRRIAANEDAFREVNEAIARGQWPGDEDVPTSFRCECARLGCNDLITLSVRDYERVRAHSRRFVVFAGHQLPDVEDVVESGAGYVIVEKVGTAGAAADALDASD